MSKKSDATKNEGPSTIVSDPLYENPVTQEYSAPPRSRQNEHPRHYSPPRPPVNRVRLSSVQSALLGLTMVLLLIDLFVPGTSPAEPFLYTAIIISSAAVSIVSIKLHQVATAVGYGFISLLNLAVLVVHFIVL